MFKHLFKKSLPEDIRVEVELIEELFKDGAQSAREQALEKCCDLGWKNAKAVDLFQADLLRCLGCEPMQKSLEDSLSYSFSHCSSSIVKKLIQATKSCNTTGRQRVAQSLGQIGARANSAENSLLHLMKDDALNVRAAACRSLGLIGALNKPTLAQLAQISTNDELIVRRNALHALANAIGHTKNPEQHLEYLNLFIQAATGSDKELHRSGIHGADKLPISCNQRISFFEDLLTRPSIPLDLSWLAQSMGKRVDECQFQGLVVHLIRHSESASIPDRASCIELFGKMGSSAAEAKPFLISLLDREHSFQCAKALWHIEKNAERIMPILLREFDDNTEGIADLCCEMGLHAKPLLPKLLEALKSEDWDTQWAAGDAIGHVAAGNADAIPDLLTALNHESSRVKGAVARSLARVGASALEPLSAIAQSDNNDKRFYAIYAMAQMGESAKPMVPMLREMLGGADDTLAFQIAMALAFIAKDDAAVPILLAAFDKPMSYSDANSALNAMKHLGARASAAIPLIDSIIRHEQDPEILEKARQAQSAILEA
jgi:HEAT repeat protein